VNRHRFWAEAWENRGDWILILLVLNSPPLLVLPFVLRDAMRGGPSVIEGRAALVGLLVPMAVATLLLSTVFVAFGLWCGACTCRRIRVTDRGVWVEAGMTGSRFTTYEKIDRVEFGSVSVEDAAYPVLRLVDRKGKGRAVGLGTGVSEQELAAYLSERGVTVEACEDRPS